MKMKTLFMALLSFAVLMLASCSDDDNDNETIEVTGISLDSDSLEIELESAAVLIATLEPAGAEGDITWTSSDPTIAAVADGVVTGLKIGTATVVASHGIYSASCEIEIMPQQLDADDLPESLQGSNYYPIQLDASTYEYIKDKVVVDLRPNEETKFLYVWESTLITGSPSGLNFYGQAESWVSLVVSNVGWSGAGFFVGDDFGVIDMTDLYANPQDYVFHVALKSAQETSSYLFKFKDGESSVGICIGSSVFVDGDSSFEPYADFTRDNEWHSIEIPVTKLNELGLFYSNTFSNNNVLEVLAGGTSGTTLDLDAMFFYKK
ncbi:Ig-like domain-containing protein [Geofilum sp. OHC36d9]|uniref:Ig-like domain-containing protein n=1 Tax=Geofilum sp. OHC36d9 TaxID=3458413 RepID=UPI004034E710